MKTFLKIIYWLAGIMAVLLIIGLLLPGTATVSRSVTIQAPPATVYPVLNDLKTYNYWMPWNQIDPAMEVEYSTQTTGKGAWYKWKSENPQVGNGQLTITESIPEKNVSTSLAFEGFAEPSTGGWDLSESGGNTTVTWKMNASFGKNPVNRWFGLFFDKMLGPQFEDGLGQLKQKIENGTIKSQK